MNVSDVVGENIEDNIWHLQSLSILISFECQKDIHFKTHPGPVAKDAAPRN